MSKQFKVTRTFGIAVDARNVRTYTSGVYEVPRDMDPYHAERARALRCGDWVKLQKKAPENKVVDVPENKAKVAKKTVRRRSTGTKPKS